MDELVDAADGDAEQLCGLVGDEVVGLPHLRADANRVSPLGARPAHQDEFAEELDALCLLSPVPKNAWRWVETAQYKLTQQGQHQAAGVIDLLVCATAVHYGHTVLHVDNDFPTVAGVLKEVEQRDVWT